VVSINTERFRTERMMDFWGRTHLRRYSSTGQGSGVIVSKEGHVLTNHHVIAGQEKISVTLHNGDVKPAHVIGDDEFLDIAVLKIDADGPFAPLKLGDSSEVQVGQMVFAVGNPFGLGETVTQGIISAKERSLSDGQRDLFQTDAAINPGNSGGPLVNLRGEIIGINVAIFSPDKENPGFQGVGFSIPSNDVRDSLTQILERGRPVRGYLGVQMRDLDPAVRGALKYDGKDGTVVMGVSPGSPAEQAGIEAGDVIVTFSGKPVRSYTQLFSWVQSAHVGVPVPVGVWRQGKQLEKQVKIVESAIDTHAETSQTPESGSDAARKLERLLLAIGLEVRDLTIPERMRGYRGVVVTSLTSDGLAVSVLKPGDLIFAINESRISSAGEFFMQLSASAVAQETHLLVLRSGESVQVTLPRVNPTK
jgi:Do/DeqQ family serine protease